jgi:DNA-binding transcriptional regulator YbjK
MARTGRRPGRSGTRDAILVAARESFTASGYDQASIRDIARRAGVDPALVHHYFGTKQELFTESSCRSTWWRWWRRSCAATATASASGSSG